MSHSIGYELYDHLNDQLPGHHLVKLWSELHDCFGYQLWRQLKDQLEGQLEAGLKQ